MSRSDRRQFNSGSQEEANQLVLGREAYEHRAWEDAYRLLSRESQAASLAVDDLERLAMSSYLTGRDEEYLRALEQTHHAYLDAGKCHRAAPAALMSLNMLVETEGRNYTPAEYSAWLDEAGFRHVETVGFDAPAANGAVIGRKP